MKGREAMVDLLGEEADDARLLTTPEGVPVPVVLADPGARLGALGIDILATMLCALVLNLLTLVSLTGETGRLASVGLVFVAFLVRIAYFALFELRWGGITPGKRIMGLRVVDRRGGPLTPGAVVARNLTREVEVFIPLGMVLGVADVARSPWEAVPLVLWFVLALALPLCNRDRLRAGDLIAGTMVIEVPSRLLLEDLAAETQSFVFTPEQLERYGIFELHVLEDVLRRPAHPETTRLRAEVCEKIQRRIGWPTPVAPQQVDTFLRDFYAAQRAFLELRLQFGEERRDKHHRPAPER